MSPLPAPGVLLGMPDSRFNKWYPRQEEVFSRIMEWYYGPERFLGLAVPTGSGKTCLSALAARLTKSDMILNSLRGPSGEALENRTLILTSTKGLQKQILRDFTRIGCVEVTGRNNFPCKLDDTLTCESGICLEGYNCNYQRSGCYYIDQYRACLDKPIVVTNYAYYLSQTRFSTGLGKIGLLVADEAHKVFEQLEKNMTIELQHTQIESLGLEMPKAQTDWSSWRLWAEAAVPRVEPGVDCLKAKVEALYSKGDYVPASLSRLLRKKRGLLKNLQIMAESEGNWIVRPHNHGYNFTPLWVADYGHLLFGDVPKVMLLSAILSHKSADTLGIPSDPKERAWYSVGSSFPPENTPIWFIPTVKVNYDTTPEELRMWLMRMDQIIERRLDRKGIIFTVSYKRRDLILQRSRHSDIMVSHSRWDVVEVVRRFKEAPAPQVLVSPSVHTGWDFSAETGVKYLIVSKIPYPDTSDPVMQAREAEDPDWGSYMAMDTLIQECGRATRAATDRIEVFILDSNWGWYWNKYKHFAPAWFQQRYRGKMDAVPDPLV